MHEGLPSAATLVQEQHTYPHQLGEVTHDVLGQDIAAHPDAYHPGLDPHMEANGIPTDRSRQPSPFDAVETAAIAAAEHTGVNGHDFAKLAEVPKSPAHLASHTELGGAIDPQFTSRTAAEQEAIGVVAELGNLAEKSSLFAANPEVAGDEMARSDRNEGVLPRYPADVEANQRAKDFLPDPYEKYDNPTAKLAESVAGPNLSRKASDVLRDSEFLGSKEVRIAVEGYYTDHYALAGAINAVVESDTLSADQQAAFEKIASDSYFSPQELHDKLERYAAQWFSYKGTYVQEALPLLVMARLERQQDPTNPALQKAELRVADMATKSLFAEASVGITTLGEQEFTVVQTMREKVLANIEQSTLFEEHEKQNLHADQDPRYEIDKATKTFWEDSRFAGQLLFHNTSNFLDVRTQGQLLPRRMQQAANGNMYHVNGRTLGGRLHSPTVHWSEYLDSRGARGDLDNPTAGTMAVPLWKVIESAPFGRDALYGVATIDQAKRTEVMPKVHITDKAGSFGAGSADYQGGGGLDRTFYASPHNVGPDAPLASAPDGYKVELDESAWWVQLGEADADRAPSFGAGEHIPSSYYIDMKDTKFGMPLQEIQAINTHNNKVLDRSVKELQRRSIAALPNKLVVPLRAGIVEFYVPDDGDDYSKPQAEFTKL
jgi:hypothetical protein